MLLIAFSHVIYDKKNTIIKSTYFATTFMLKISDGKSLVSIYTNMYIPSFYAFLHLPLFTFSAEAEIQKNFWKIFIIHISLALISTSLRMIVQIIIIFFVCYTLQSCDSTRSC